MKEIYGCTPLKTILANNKYSISFYQREYLWGRAQIKELIDDLTSEFLEFYRPDNLNVMNYGIYFMGSIVTSNTSNTPSLAIVDGQQRLSSITLLLSYLNNRLKSNNEEQYNLTVLESMIYSAGAGMPLSFNLVCPDRETVMEAIYNDKIDQISPTDSSESAKNLYYRYQDICELFPVDEIGLSDAENNGKNVLSLFASWLVEKVCFNVIKAETEHDAQKIFVTMNDRGLNLTPTEILKAYLLSKICDNNNRKALDSCWKQKVNELKDVEKNGEDACIKAWLRAQYANSIRERHAGAENRDFDIIGGPFHKWISEQRDELQLEKSTGCENFIKTFFKMADVYMAIKKAETTFSPKTKYIYYNGQIGFTMQPMMLLSPICQDDSADVIEEKMNLVARFIDIYILYRVLNSKSLSYNTMKNQIFNFVRQIRGLGISELKQELLKMTENLSETICGQDIEKAIEEYTLTPYWKPKVKHILARVTAFVEESCDVEPHYLQYISTDNRNPYEIEHIITDHYEWFNYEYNDEVDFSNWRNKLGGLLLLKKSINASLNDKKYAEKLCVYSSAQGNIYAASLTSTVYVNNPRFRAFIDNKKLAFEAYENFGKEELTKRTKLFAQLVKLVWNDDMFR